MDVRLAGFNVDVENIKVLKQYLADLNQNDLEELRKLEWTPETISASYARISRDSRTIDLLREEARKEIEKARKSNNTIIFSMGHSSIAEHAVFNLDIVNISRLLSEELEKSRLASFTEKSQRYIKIGEDLFIPDFKDQKIAARYRQIAVELFKAYEVIHDKLVPYFTEKYPVQDINSSKYRDVVNLAKEDARYILPLGTLTQVGMTANARTYEKIIKKLNAHRLQEANQLAESIAREIKQYAPSLIKYLNPSEYDKGIYRLINQKLPDSGTLKAPQTEVELITGGNEIDQKVIALFIMKLKGLAYSEAKTLSDKMTVDQRKNIILQIFQKISPFDPILKEFEGIDFEFNMVVSASAFAQLKRHRMATIIDSDYYPELGVKIPPAITEIKLDEFFMDTVRKTENLFNEILHAEPEHARYILTNAHRKSVYLKCNFRELTHIARLRMDKHSQWDIRNLASLIVEAVQEKSGFAGKILCGKDAFEDFKLSL